MKIVICSLFCLFFCASAAIAKGEHLLFVTEEFPPYNFAVENHLTEGVSVDQTTLLSGLGFEVVKEMARRSPQFKVDFKLYPWLRSYEIATSDPNTAIFSIGRNNERENLFHWVGIIAPAKFYLFSLQSRFDIHVSNLEDAKRYKLGAFPKSVREQYLLSKGFEPNVNLVSVYSYERLFNLLNLGRIDLWPMNELLARHIVSTKGRDPDKTLRRVLELSELSPGGYYLAFNKQTDERIARQFQVALDQMHADGTYQRILDKYLGSHSK